jgi:hypothetical protein
VSLAAVDDWRPLPFDRETDLVRPCYDQRSRPRGRLRDGPRARKSLIGLLVVLPSEVVKQLPGLSRIHNRAMLMTNCRSDYSFLSWWHGKRLVTNDDSVFRR